MKTPLKLCCAALLGALAVSPLLAQPGPGMGGQGNGPATTQRAPRDCAKAPAPEQCKARQEARSKALETCKDKAGPARRDCMHDHMPPPDCAKAPNPQRCEAMQKAHEACKGKVGPERRQCMNDARPAR